MPDTPLNRRNFFRATAASLPLMGARAADPKRRVALVGSGWYGKNDLFRLVQVDDVEIVALCDPDSKSLAADQKTASTRHKSGKTPRGYGDFRELLKEEQPDIVEVAAPDHWHCLPAIAAMQSGADVYVQKPISVDVIEGQSMVAAARKYGRVVQVGTQRRSAPHLIEARDRIQSGMLGKISHAEVCCYVYRGPRGNPPDIAPPTHLDYEMWTGPAPMRPFCQWTHPRRWRYFMEYGNGVIGDMCIHMLDLVRWTLDLGWPSEIYSTGGIFVDKESKANTPDTQTATFKFPDLNVIWTHRNWGHPVDPEYPWSYFIYGEKGVFKGSTSKWEFIPVDLSKQRVSASSDIQPAIRRDAPTELDKFAIDKVDNVESRLPAHEFPVLRAHMKDFLSAIDNRSRPVADIEQGHISTACCILANISLELGRSLKWDPASHRVVGDDKANTLLARPYRKPWVHPTPENI